MRVIERVRRSLDDVGYPKAGLMEPGYILSEMETGQVRLQWGYDNSEILLEPNDWVRMCTEFLISEGFDVQPGDWAVGDGGAILIGA